jgi:hypothetical protein
MDQVKTPCPQCPQCEQNIDPVYLLEDSSIYESFMHFVCSECGCEYRVIAILENVKFTVKQNVSNQSEAAEPTIPYESSGSLPEWLEIDGKGE